jgi:hypothetical protein
MGPQGQKPSKPFRFLDLAPEIRLKIYAMIATSPQSHIDISSPFSSPHTYFPHALLLTCTQIYHELRPLYFISNAFSVTVLRRNESWSHLLTPSFLDNRRQIRSLRIKIVRWGTKDFFCRSLIPSLEDCILNGRLRELEVVIRDQSANYAFLGSLNDDSSKELQSWRMLRKLLMDPYLEKVTLKGGRFSVVSTGVEGMGGNVWDLEGCEDISYLLGKAGDEQDKTLIKVV